ncbi:hypothetical protein [Desulfovibrio sp. ZJ200]|uniref:hypothetical protein n=1 Tax=Desulfovibrio sp. ZJ200 TaxID=2709792 RepID=UPI0013EB0D61|nr:hypothetical protein [Desulfovibrio sp. ZJ200]
MLNPNSDRLDYGRILSPPAGCRLDFAAGTTYSLDLDALVGATLALILSEETDSALLNNPMCLLEALRTAGEQVALFCEDGQIHLPGKVTPLYILLERMVFPVRTKKHRGVAGYPAFHPKFWMLRYRDAQGGFVYRVAVLSRNLTFDHSWDVSYYMDGKPAGEATDKNQPVCDFLRHLDEQLPGTPVGRAKRRQLRSLIRELERVEFSTGEKEFYDFEFLPTGIKGHNITSTPLFTDTFHELLVMSPFLSGGVIRAFDCRNDGSPIQNSRYALFTRADALAKLKPEDCSNFQLFTMRDAVIDGEMELSGDDGSARRQDIHAKLYMVNKSSDTDLYLGSLNASHNAVHHNVEFMIRLRSKRRYLNIDKLMASLRGSEPGGEGDPFQPVTLDSAAQEEDDGKSGLGAVVKELVRCGPAAQVSGDGERHILRLTFGTLPELLCEVTVKPLLAGPALPLAEAMEFPGLTLTQLSQFFVVSVSDGGESIQRVLLIPVEGMPEDRERAVVSGVVKDVGFCRYIAFLLGDDTILSTLEMGTAGAGDGTAPRRNDNAPALYEKMLQAAATAPEKLRDVERLMETVAGDEVVPEDFKALYQAFKKAVKLDV